MWSARVVSKVTSKTLGRAFFSAMTGAESAAAKPAAPHSATPNAKPTAAIHPVASLRRSETKKFVFDAHTLPVSATRHESQQ
jgi:hypothetical protein